MLNGSEPPYIVLMAVSKERVTMEDNAIDEVEFFTGLQSESLITGERREGRQSGVSSQDLHCLG